MQSRATVLIQSAVNYVGAAAMKLMSSKFSETAIDTFRANVWGELTRDSSALLNMGWADGNGDGDPPTPILHQYRDEQLHHLDLWIADIQAQHKLVGGVGRAQLYGESLGLIYQRAYILARGSRSQMPDLPGYPRDGGTPCLMRCRCRWRIVRRSAKEGHESYEAFWVLGPVEHCKGCHLRAIEWNPLKTMKINGQWVQIDALGKWLIPDTSPVQ